MSRRSAARQTAAPQPVSQVTDAPQALAVVAPDPNQIEAITARIKKLQEELLLLANGTISNVMHYVVEGDLYYGGMSLEHVPERMARLTTEVYDLMWALDKARRR